MKIVIPEKHYVRIYTQYGSKVQGSMTDWGEDAAAKRRIATVDRRKTANSSSSVIDNVPMYGFKVVSHGDKSWGIEDPRGFIIYVEPENLLNILETTTIENGEVQTDCVWAKKGSLNWLLSVNSPDYINAVEITDVVNSTVKIKSIKKGNKVFLKSGRQGIYLGLYYFLYYQNGGYYQDAVSCTGPTKISKPLYAVLYEKERNNYRYELELRSTIKVGKIVETDEMSDAEAEASLNEYINDKTVDITTASYLNILAGVVEDFKIEDFKFNLLPNTSGKKPWDKKIESDRKIFVRMKNGKFGLARAEHYGSIENYIIHIDESELVNSQMKLIKANSKYGPSAKTQVDPNDLDAEYNIDVEYTTKLGNEIRIEL